MQACACPGTTLLNWQISLPHIDVVLISAGTNHPCIASNWMHPDCTNHWHPACNSSTYCPSSNDRSRGLGLEELELEELELEQVASGKGTETVKEMDLEREPDHR